MEKCIFSSNHENYRLLENKFMYVWLKSDQYENRYVIHLIKVNPLETGHFPFVMENENVENVSIHSLRVSKMVNYQKPGGQNICKN
jgi:hypothetical protein